MICFGLFLSLFPASTTAQEEKKKRLVIVCSTTQVADFTRQVVGDRCEVISVLSAGEDPHTYKPRTQDSNNVARCDLCIENGWNLEGHQWMKTLASEIGKPIVTCVNGIEPLQVEQHDETVDDPHAWFSPANAAKYVDNITEAVCELDAQHADEYRARAQLYKFQLSALDSWIKRQLVQLPKERRVLVSHHDAFGYFCNRYNFRGVSPSGWTTEELVDPTVEKKQNVIKEIRDAGVKAIFVETTINPEFVRGIANDAGVTIGGSLYSDAMGPPGSAGETYIGMMRENVITILSALK